MRTRDIYEQWEFDGILELKLKFIQEMVSKKITQKEIAKELNITEKTLIKLKYAHVRLHNAFVLGDYELKDKLISSIYKRAVGYDYEESSSVIEETSSGTKKKVTRNKKHLPPDYYAARYLLITKFGRECNERKDEIDLMEKRAEKGDDWTDIIKND